MIFAGLQTLIDPNENEEKLWRMIVGLRRQLEGFGGALTGFPWSSGPYGGDPGDPPPCGSLLYLGCNGQVTADNSCTVFLDWQNKRVGINTCSPAYTLDIYSNECGSNTLALRTGLLSNDVDSYPNFDTNPVTRIRSTRNSADPGGSLDFYTNTTAGTLTQRLIIDPSGLADFKGQIQIRGGSPAAGSLLQSDADGLAVWAAPSAISGIDHGSLIGLADDDHPQYRLESEDHTHQSTGLQGGQLDHGLALTGLGDDDHTQYVLHSILTTRGDIFKRGITTTERLGIGATGTVLKSDGTDPAWGNVAASEVTSPANVTAGSTKISLGGTPTGAALQAFSIDVNQANLDHGSIGGLADDDHTIYLLNSGLREWDEQASDPSTPASTKWKLYFKAGGLYHIDDLGAVTGPLGTGGGGGSLPAALFAASMRG